MVLSAAAAPVVVTRRRVAGAGGHGGTVRPSKCARVARQISTMLIDTPA